MARAETETEGGPPPDTEHDMCIKNVVKSTRQPPFESNMHVSSYPHFIGMIIGCSQNPYYRIIVIMEE
ncbi:MAG: hypothetical protein Q9224_000824 [Gallowayella concinna]